MEKRTEAKKCKKQNRKVMFKKTTAIVFCIAFLIFAVVLSDLSTKRMMQCRDDKHALNMAYNGNNVVRIDVAGERYYFNVSGIIKISSKIAETTERYVTQMINTIQDKLSNKH